jgi:hypothetical protein
MKPLMLLLMFDVNEIIDGRYTESFRYFGLPGAGKWCRLR